MSTRKKSTNSKFSKEFHAEAEDLLDLLGKGLLRLEKSLHSGGTDLSLINGIFRTAHTLKGVADVFDFKDMVSLAHALESALDAIRLGKLHLTDDVLDVFLRTHGLMSRMASGDTALDPSADLKRLAAILKKAGKGKRSRRKEDHVDGELLDHLTEYEEHRLVENIKDGNNILIVETGLKLVSFDKDYESFIEYLQKEAEVVATLPSKKKSTSKMIRIELLVGSSMALAELKKFLKIKFTTSVELVHAKLGLSRPDTAPFITVGEETDDLIIDGAGEILRGATNSVRVDITKLDAVMNIIGELGLIKSSLSKLSSDLKVSSVGAQYGSELARLEKHFDKKVSELRDRLIDVRLVQIGQLFVRYETLISRLGRQTGKEVRMVTSGAETELDKFMVEHLSDPIMHTIRNIVDHAIESPEEREKLGKERTGTITLNAFQKGSSVVVEVSDNGCGIDEELIKKRALSKGLVTEDYVNGLSSREALDLLFLPGFTTKDVVSEVSGRGVGLDAVKENIAKLSGVIDIETSKGKGTKFVFTIPITLAIIQAIIVEDGGGRYALPLNSVTEVITVDPDDVVVEDGSSVIRLGERKLPFVRLSTFMGKEAGREGSGGVLHGIVAGIAEHRLCIAAERIVEQLDLVIKPLSGSLKVPGIAGAADFGMNGKGGTVLVLDVSGVIESLESEKREAKVEAFEGEGFVRGGANS